MKLLFAFLTLTVPCLADEIVLKSGQRIEWKSIEDAGETYVVVTSDGSRVPIKRTDVESFAKTEPVVLLTGASISFDKKSKLETVDLLKQVDLGKDALAGTWKFVQGLSGSASGDSSARLQIRYMPPVDEYNLTVVVERAEGTDNVGLGFPTPGGGQCMWHWDVDAGAYQGILVPEGGDGHRKITAVPGKSLQTGKARTFIFMVRKAALVIQCDGKDISVSKQDWSKISILPQCRPSVQDAFSIFALKSGVRVSKLTVSFPSGTK